MYLSQHIRLYIIRLVGFSAVSFKWKKWFVISSFRLAARYYWTSPVGRSFITDDWFTLWKYQRVIKTVTPALHSLWPWYLGSRRHTWKYKQELISAPATTSGARAAHVFLHYIWSMQRPWKPQTSQNVTGSQRWENCYIQVNEKIVTIMVLPHHV